MDDENRRMTISEAVKRQKEIRQRLLDEIDDGLQLASERWDLPEGWDIVTGETYGACTTNPAYIGNPAEAD